MDPNIALAAGALLVTGLVLVIPVARSRRTERDDLEQDLRILHALPDDGRDELEDAIRRRANALARRSLWRRDSNLILSGVALVCSGSVFILSGTPGDGSALDTALSILGVAVLVGGLFALVGGLMKR